MHTHPNHEWNANQAVNTHTSTPTRAPFSADTTSFVVEQPVPPTKYPDSSIFVFYFLFFLIFSLIIRKYCRKPIVIERSTGQYRWHVLYSRIITGLRIRNEHDTVDCRLHPVSSPATTSPDSSPTRIKDADLPPTYESVVSDSHYQHKRAEYKTEGSRNDDNRLPTYDEVMTRQYYKEAP